MRSLLHALAILLLTLGTARGADFLEPEQAFRFSARAVDAQTAEVTYRIADGYYMYRDKFRFAVEGAADASPRFPAGKMKDDENFGRVEIFRGELKFPVSLRDAAGEEVTLKVTSQGCADAGLCYVPSTQSARLTFPSAVRVSAPAEPPARAVQPAAALAGLRMLSDDLGGAPKFLPPDEAFKFEARVEGDVVRARFIVEPDYYLYRDKTRFRVLAPKGASIGKVDFPQAEPKDDPNFGRVYVYHHDFETRVGLANAHGKVSLEATYQGCSEKGVCYPPITKTVSLTLPATATLAAPAATAPVSGADVPAPAGIATAPSPTATPTESATPDEPASAQANAAASDENSQLARALSGGFWSVLGVFFLAGLGLSLTPCVFPMIPILSGIIVGQKHVTHRTGFMLSLAYVLGMAITYAAAGVAAALSGTLISNALQNPIALSIGAGIFVLLALSMFGFYELQLPSALQSRMTEASNRMKGGNLLGVFGMGALSAVIVGPCVAPPLAAALAYIAQTNNMALGGFALFVLALGMGVPLLAVGASGGALLPRAGAWMNGVKYTFGVLMLAVAIYLISPVIPQVVVMLLWAALLIASGVYLKALDTLAVNASGWTRLWKGMGILLLVSGIALVVGALSGGRDLLQPLAGLRGGTAVAAEAHGLQFERVKSVAELDARLAAAAGRPVMLDFYADWCVSCKEMERFTFTDPTVRARLANTVLLQADVTDNTADDAALLKRFGLFGPPGIIFWSADGIEQATRVIGYQKTGQFLQSLEQAGI